MSDVRRIEQEKRRKAEDEQVLESEDQKPERLSNVSSQPSGQPAAGPVGNQPNTDKQPILDKQPNMGHLMSPPLKLLASIPEVRGEARVPHRYTDHLCRVLKPDEQAVFLQLYRLSWGWNKETCFISNPRLSERSNVPLSSMKRAVAGLINKGLVEKTGHTNGFAKEQGVEYRVFNMGSQPNMNKQPNMSSQPNMAPNIIKNTQINTHTATLSTESDKKELVTRGVSVGSKFTIEECKKYAAHLSSTGQGITNPGGYATTIYRTGEADALIAAFLEPLEPSKKLDASQCPDCLGTGFYYPNGTTGGVVKCKHVKMITDGEK
jgi:hypothetical protein